MFGKNSSQDIINQSGRSHLGESMQVEGEINSSGAIDVAGLINGNVYAKEMIIFDTGSVTGNLFVDKIEISGHVEGKIIADTVILGREAIIKGDISFKTALKTEEGAEIEGYIKKTKKIIKEEDKDLESISEKPKLGKPTLVRSEEKEVV